MKKKIFILVCLGFLLSGMALTVKAQSNISVYIDDYLRGQGWPVASGEDGSSARVEGPWGVVYNGFDYDYNEGYFRWYIYSSCTYNLVIQQSAGKSLADSVIYVRLIPAVKGKPNDRDTVTNYTTLPYSFKITQAQVDAAKDAGLGNGVVLIPFSIGDMPAKYDSLTLLYKVNPPDGGGYLSSYTVGWNWNFFNTAKVAVDYIAPGPVNYTGKADLSITGGAPNMVRSLNGGITWTPVYDGDNNIIPLTPTEISNLGSIYFKSPNSCSYQSFSLGGGGGALPGGLPRAVTIPAVSGVTMYPFTTGVHRVESGRDFVFTIRVNDPSLKPNVGTDRNRPEGEDVTVTPAGDGVYEIVVQTVNSALKLTIELVPIGAGIEATEGSSVWSAGGQIHATSVTPATADIYSVAGAAVTRLALGAGETAVTSLPAGVYFVRMSGKVYKVVVE